MKRRLLSVLLTFTMIVSMVTMAIGTGGLVGSAAEGDATSQEVNIYWARSKEFFFEELEKPGISVYDNVLELEASSNSVYTNRGGAIYYGSESYDTFTGYGVIRTPDGIKAVTDPVPSYLYTDIVNDAKLALAYADEALLNGTAPANILAAFNAEKKAVPQGAMGGLRYVWDGGNGTYSGDVTGVSAEFNQLGNTVISPVGTASHIPGPSGVSNEELPPITKPIVSTQVVNITPITFTLVGTENTPYFAVEGYSWNNQYPSADKSTQNVAQSGKYYYVNTKIQNNYCNDTTYAVEVVVGQNGEVTIYDNVVVANATVGQRAETNTSRITKTGENAYTIYFGLDDGTGNCGECLGGDPTEVLSYVLEQADDIINDYTLDADYKSAAAVAAFKTAVADGQAMLTAGTASKADMDEQAQDIIDAAAAIEPKDYYDYNHDTENTSIRLAFNDTSFDGNLDVTYLGSDTGFAGFIKSTEFAYLDVILEDGEIPLGAKVVFESSDPSVVVVTDTGRAYPKGQGTATITAKIMNGDEIFRTSNSLSVTSRAVVDNDFVDTNSGGNDTMGIFCNGVKGGNEPHLADTNPRAGSNTGTDKGEFATWLTHTLTNVDNTDHHIQGSETIRRFTGYFEVTDADYYGFNFFVGDRLQNKVVAGDDSFYIFVNGNALLRASTNDKGGVQFEDVSGNGFTESNTLTLAARSGDDPHYFAYAGSSSFHAHTNETNEVDIKQYLKPGEVNRIDIFTGDYSDGGGMNKLHLFKTSNGNVYSEGTIAVTAKPFEKAADANVADAFTDSAKNLEGDVVAENTPVYYAYEVKNTSDAVLHNIELIDEDLGIKITKDGVFTKDGNGDYTVESDIVLDSTIAAKLESLASGGSFVISVDNALFSKSYTVDPVADQGKEEIFRQNRVDASAAYSPTDGDDYSKSATAYSVTYVKLEANIVKQLVDDVVVIDYGLEVDVDVLANDGLNNGTIAGVSTSANGLTNEVNAKAYTGFTSSADIDYGTVSVKDNKVAFVPTGIVDDITTAYYAATDDNENYGAAELKIVPATSVYYEDCFGQAISAEGNALTQVQNVGFVYSGNWSIVNENDDYTEPENGSDTNAALPVQEYDNEALYGYDDAYDVHETLSGGSSHAVGGSIAALNDYTLSDIFNGTTKDPEIDSLSLYERFKLTQSLQNEIFDELDENYDENYYATFQFVGTGFDIISHTTTNSGRINAKVYKVTDGTSYTFAADGKLSGGTAVKDITSDNLYTDGAINQVPVISVKDLEVGNYIVQLAVNSKSFALQSKGNAVYIDAVRIYNPLDASKAEDYYTEKELNAQSYELRDMVLLGVGEKSDTGEQKEGSIGKHSVTYIPKAYHTESKFAKNDYDVNDYINVGPKNELYVQNGDKYIFTYNFEDVPEDIQIFQVESKLLKSGDDEFTITVENTRSGKEVVITVDSLTGMFYDVSDVLEGVQSGDKFEISIDGTSGETLSLTNIKLNENVTLKSVAVNPDSISIDQGDTITVSDGGKTTLTATLSPEGVINDGYTWSSSDPSIIGVDSSTGVITAVGSVGNKATITVTSTGDSTVKDTIEVEIVAVKAESIVMYKGEAEVANGGSETVVVTKGGAEVDTITFTAEVLPENASNTGYKFEVSNEGIATISNGTVTVDPNAATAYTSVTITVKANADNTIAATYTVNVDVKVPVTGIEILEGGVTAEDKLDLTDEDTEFTLTAEVNPTDADDTTYTFTTNNSTIVTINGTTATVDPSKAKSASTTVTVTATANGDTSKSDTVTYTITKAVVDAESIMITANGEDAGAQLVVGTDESPLTLEAVVGPEDVTDGTYTFTKDEEGTNFVTIDNETGKVTIDATGATARKLITITATSKTDSNIKDVIRVIVKPAGGGSGGGYADAPLFDWNASYTYGDIVQHSDGNAYRFVRSTNGTPWTQPAGYTTSEWEFLGPVGSGGAETIPKITTFEITAPANNETKNVSANAPTFTATASAIVTENADYDVEWAVIGGNTFATVAPNGTVTVLDDGQVTLQATLSLPLYPDEVEPVVRTVTFNVAIAHDNVYTFYKDGEAVTSPITVTNVADSFTISADLSVDGGEATAVALTADTNGLETGVVTISNGVVTVDPSKVKANRVVTITGADSNFIINIDYISFSLENNSDTYSYEDWYGQKLNFPAVVCSDDSVTNYTYVWEIDDDTTGYGDGEGLDNTFEVSEAGTHTYYAYVYYPMPETGDIAYVVLPYTVTCNEQVPVTITTFEIVEPDSKALTYYGSSATYNLPATNTVLSDGSDAYTVTWNVEGPATVNGNTFTVTGTGEVVLKATCTLTDGSDSEERTITYSVAKTPVTVAITGADKVTVGSTITLTATVTPNTVTPNTVTWSSDNTAVATVDATTGVVTPVAVGTATITARSSFDNTKTDTKTITVEAAGGGEVEVIPFSWTMTYKIGDIVEHEGHLYECLIAGQAQVPPAGAGYDNPQWKYISSAN